MTRRGRWFCPPTSGLELAAIPELVDLVGALEDLAELEDGEDLVDPEPTVAELERALGLADRDRELELEERTVRSPLLCDTREE
jgi:hypothetical protein